MEIAEDFESLIKKAYFSLDHDRDGIVSLSDLKVSCNLQSIEEASELLKTLKKSEKAFGENLTYSEFAAGISEFPQILSQFNKGLIKNCPELAKNDLEFEERINLQIYDSIISLGILINYNKLDLIKSNSEELFETLDQIIENIGKKLVNDRQNYELLKSLSKFSRIIQSQNLFYRKKFEEFNKNSEELEFCMKETSQKCQIIEKKNESLIEELTQLEKKYIEIEKVLYEYRSKYDKIQGLINEENETKSHENAKKNDNVFEKPKAFSLEIGMYTECKRIQESNNNKEKKKFIIEKSLNHSNMNKNFEKSFLKEELESKNQTLKEKNLEIMHLSDMIGELHLQIESLKEKNKSLLIDSVNEKNYHLNYDSDSEGSLKSFKENSLNYSYAEKSEKNFMLKPFCQMLDKESQTEQIIAKSRNSCLGIF